MRARAVQKRGGFIANRHKITDSCSPTRVARVHMNHCCIADRPTRYVLKLWWYTVQQGGSFITLSYLLDCEDYL